MDDEMNDDEDVYIMQESGKMIVQDFELRDASLAMNKKNRKKVGYGVDSDTDSDDEDAHTMSSKKGMSSGALKKVIKQQQQNSTLMHRSQQSAGIQKSKTKY